VISQHASSPSPERLAYRIGEFCHAIGLGRTRVYREIANGRLEVVKVGRRTLVPRRAADEFISHLKREAAR
jgi:excisionase family DNA binding protein